MRRASFLAGTAAIALPTVAKAQSYPGGFLRQSSIGVSVPLSGPLGEYGARIVRGVQAAIDEANRFTAPLQRAFGIRTFDDQNSGAIATTNVSIASADPAIIAMIGNLTADVTLQALPQYANVSFPLIVPTITADSITAHGYRNVFRLPTKDSTEGTLVARATLQGKKRMAVAAITIENNYGTDVARGYVDQARSDHHDVTLITLPDGFDPGAMAESILKTPYQMIFLCGKVDRLGSFADVLRTAGYQGDFSASDGFYAQTTIGTYATPLDGALVASSFPPLNRIPSIFSLFNDFQHSVGTIDGFSAFGYAAAQLIIASVGRTNVLNRFSLLTAMQRGGTYNTIVGQYSFNFSGDATLPNVYLYRVTSKGFEFVKPAVATGFVL